MMPGTAYKHDRLVEMAEAEYGWTPKVSGPDDAYRRLSVQEYYFETMPPGNAASPGTSSHGGTYDFGDGEVEQGAVDYGNWGVVGQSAFYDLARRAGFVPGVFSWEPWHVFDPSPWFVPNKPTPIKTPQEDDMLALSIGFGNNRHLCTLGVGVFRHLISTDNPNRIRDIVTAEDKWLETDGNELPKLLHTYGCDLHIWDVRSNGAFVVYDPRDNSVRSGGMWSATAARARETQIALGAKIDSILRVTSKQTADFLSLREGELKSDPTLAS